MKRFKYCKNDLIELEKPCIIRRNKLKANAIAKSFKSGDREGNSNHIESIVHCL